MKHYSQEFSESTGFGSGTSPSKTLSQRDHILRLLRERGPAGISNFELNKVCLRFGARIFELRRLGFSIRTKNTGGGRFLFVLEGTSAAGRSAQESSSRSAHAVDTLPLFAEARL
jgi:hypothetical protein